MDGCIPHILCTIIISFGCLFVWVVLVHAISTAFLRFRPAFAMISCRNGFLTSALHDAALNTLLSSSVSLGALTIKISRLGFSMVEGRGRENERWGDCKNVCLCLGSIQIQLRQEG